MLSSLYHSSLILHSVILSTAINYSLQWFLNQGMIGFVYLVKIIFSFLWKIYFYVYWNNIMWRKLFAYWMNIIFVGLNRYLLCFWLWFKNCSINLPNQKQMKMKKMTLQVISTKIQHGLEIWILQLVIFMLEQRNLQSNWKTLNVQI